MAFSNARPLGVYYEHPAWFRLLFAELERREIPVQHLDATRHRFVPSARPRLGLVFNRMSPSAYLRRGGHAIFYTRQYLEHLETAGVRVVNGSSAFDLELSKARQLSLLDRLGLRYPATVVINHPEQALAAADHLRYPIVVKPNVGGSGAGITKFDAPADLRRAMEMGEVRLGIDHTGLVQEYHRPADDCIMRVEVLGGRVLYGIRVPASGETFNLCPADLCRSDAAGNGRAAPEAFRPASHLADAVERILRTAHIEVGGVEYLVDAHSGRVYFYDINATSNFVVGAPELLGFDPHVRLVDYLEAQAPAA